MLKFLEVNRYTGFNALEISKSTACSEPRVRKHLYDLVDESIIDARGDNPVFYGFVGFDCEADIKERCPDTTTICLDFAHHCIKREEYIHAEED